MELVLQFGLLNGILPGNSYDPLCTLHMILMLGSSGGGVEGSQLETVD